MGEEYDYIVVGAGTIGCLLANRPSADPNMHIQPIDQGAPNPLIHTAMSET